MGPQSLALAQVMGLMLPPYQEQVNRKSLLAILTQSFSILAAWVLSTLAAGTLRIQAAEASLLGRQQQISFTAPSTGRVSAADLHRLSIS